MTARRSTAHASGQLAEWRAWFGRGHNRTAFLEYYDIPPMLAWRQLAPRYLLIHGRRENFESVPRRREKRAELARPDERLMSFDRLTPAKNSVLFSTARKGQDGYRVISVPPSLTLFNTGSECQLVQRAAGAAGQEAPVQAHRCEQVLGLEPALLAKAVPSPAFLEHEHVQPWHLGHEFWQQVDELAVFEVERRYP